MNKGIRLNYEICNAEAADSVASEKYIVKVNPSQVKEFKMPAKLAGNNQNVYLKDPTERRSDFNGTTNRLR